MRTCSTIDYREQDDMLLVDLDWEDSKSNVEKLLDAGWEWEDGKLKKRHSKKEIDLLVDLLPEAYWMGSALLKGGD